MRAGHPDRNRRAFVEGSPGVEPRLRGMTRMVWPFPLAAALAGYLIRSAWPRPAIPAPLAGGGLAALSAGVFTYLFFSRRRLVHFIKGARGEESVARELALLPSKYQVFHGVRIPVQFRRETGQGGSSGENLRRRLSERVRASGAWADCDHIVLGPRGVVVIETKNWAGPVTLRDGRILVKGEEPDRSPLEQVKRAAEALRSAFARASLGSVPVMPVVVFASNALSGPAQGVDGVRICRLDALRAVLEEGDTPTLPEGIPSRVAACVRRWVNPV